MEATSLVTNLYHSISKEILVEHQVWSQRKLQSNTGNSRNPRACVTKTLELFLNIKVERVPLHLVQQEPVLVNK
mgnify:CR=1 FL=1